MSRQWSWFPSAADEPWPGEQSYAAALRADGAEVTCPLVKAGCPHSRRRGCVHGNHHVDLVLLLPTTSHRCYQTIDAQSRPPLVLRYFGTLSEIGTAR